MDPPQGGASISVVTYTTHTCTVGPSAVTGERCGKPAVTSFTSRSGKTYYECAEHAPADAPVVTEPVRETAATLGIKTASTRPYVLVRDGAIVGYADAHTTAVAKRAAKLGARIIPTK